MMGSPWITVSEITASPSKSRAAAMVGCMTGSASAVSGGLDPAACASLIVSYSTNVRRRVAPNFLLQLQNSIHQRFGGRRAARHVDVDRHDAVATAHDRIA